MNVENIFRNSNVILTRRDLLNYALGISGLSLLSVAATSILLRERSNSNFETNTNIPDRGLPQIRWKLLNKFGEYKEKQSPLLFKAPYLLKERLEAMTNKGLIIDIQQVVDDKDSINIIKMVSDGKFDCCYSGIYYDTTESGSQDNTYFPLFFSAAIPFGLNAQEQIAWLSYQNPDLQLKIKKNFNSLTDEQIKSLSYVQTLCMRLDLRIVSFSLANTGSQMGGWFRFKVQNTESLKGKTMRIPSLGKLVLQDIGMNSSTYNVKDFTKKFIDGEINAMEWTSPYDDFNLFQQVNPNFLKDAKDLYYYYPSWWEPSLNLDLQVNLDSWLNLPSNYQEILRAACWETHNLILAEYEQKNSEFLQKPEIKNKLLPFPPNFIETARKTTDDLLNDYSNKVPLFKEVYKEWKNFKTNLSSWSDTAISRGSNK
jgi:TRAP-type mannitol/chloroaromatic compound transport system substrate-binding protein